MKVFSPVSWSAESRIRRNSIVAATVIVLGALAGLWLVLSMMKPQ
jgi:hypothetical protein